MQKRSHSTGSHSTSSHAAASKDNKPSEGDAGGLMNRMLASRTVVISGQVDSELAQKVMQQLVLLDHDDSVARPW